MNCESTGLSAEIIFVGGSSFGGLRSKAPQFRTRFVSMFRVARRAISIAPTTSATRCVRGAGRPPGLLTRTLSSKPPKPAAGGKSSPGRDEEWLHSEERSVALSRSERMIMGIAVVSCTLAIAMFTSTKWEVERRVREQLSEEDQKRWYAGTYVPDLNRNSTDVRCTETKKLMEELRQKECDGFEAADAFTGSREGMVFKSGPVRVRCPHPCT